MQVPHFSFFSAEFTISLVYYVVYVVKLFNANDFEAHFFSSIIKGLVRVGDNKTNLFYNSIHLCAKHVFSIIVN